MNGLKLQSVNVCQKQIHSLTKQTSIYEEVPESFLEDTHVKKFFWKTCNNSQSHHPVVLVSKISNKYKFAIKIYRLCDIKTEQRYNLGDNLQN